MTYDVGVAAQEAAEKHLNACWDAYYAQEDGEDVEGPSEAPFCGCQTCVVRETLAAAWPILQAAFQ